MCMHEARSRQWQWATWALKLIGVAVFLWILHGIDRGKLAAVFSQVSLLHCSWGLS